MRSVWMCPSRGRPGNVARLLEAWPKVTVEAVLMVVADDDDPLIDEYRALTYPFRTHLVTGPRLRLGPTLNEYGPELARKFDAVGFLGDDHLPRELGFDYRLELEVFMGKDIVYGNDLLQGESLPTAVLQSSRLITALGRYVPPGLTHLYLDDYWLRIGLELDSIAYLPHVIIEHLHPGAGKADSDAGYAEVNACDSADKAVWQAYLENGLAADVERARHG